MFPAQLLGGAKTLTLTISRDAYHNFETVNGNEPLSPGSKDSKQKFDFEMDMNAGSTLAAGVFQAVDNNIFFYNKENMFSGDACYCYCWWSASYSYR
mmetsp:Transcript_16585/g.20242  ORF Transcript_16585/g.20242 Transcript_16585/m.20242 type:complete len:97 (-) Transcript_16585:275-565(-)